MGTLALIGLGSNLGDRKATLDTAVAALGGTPGVTLAAVSSFHETRAIGGPGGQGGYLNAAALVRTILGPHALLEALHEIERRAGRARDVRWGARTLDLDLLLHGETFLDEPLLKVPHPRLGVRRFVLAPAAEIAPLLMDVVSGLTIAKLRQIRDRRPGYAAIDGPASPVREYLYRSLIRELGATPLDGEFEQGAFYDYAMQALQLQRENLPADRSGDGWFVSDYCLSPWRHSVDLEEIEEFRPGCFDETEKVPGALPSRNRTLRPTFAVALGRRLPRKSGFAWIRPESHDPEALVAEVLAACAASRGG